MCVLVDHKRELSLTNHCFCRINLAYSLQMSGKFQQAWTQFTTVVEQNARCQAAYEGRAIVNLQMSNLFGALQDVNASIKIRASAELHTNRGVINLVSAKLFTINMLLGGGEKKESYLLWDS